MAARAKCGACLNPRRILPIWRIMNADTSSALPKWHGTTILSVRKNGRVVVAGDGQVSMGPTIMKPNARKVRRLGDDGSVIGGFAGARRPMPSPCSSGWKPSWSATVAS
jgi:ATP-dependent HslUV protease subunit HslV